MYNVSIAHAPYYHCSSVPTSLQVVETLTLSSPLACSSSCLLSHVSGNTQRILYALRSSTASKPQSEKNETATNAGKAGSTVPCGGCVYSRFVPSGVCLTSAVRRAHQHAASSTCLPRHRPPHAMEPRSRLLPPDSRSADNFLSYPLSS